MHTKPQKHNQLFLEKFEGKKNIISREGLLHLLQNKRQSLIDSTEFNTSEKKKPHEKPISTPLQERKKPHGTPPGPPNEKETNKKISISREKLMKRSESLSQQLEPSHKPHQNIKQLKSQQLAAKKLKLPAINKSTSHSTHSQKYTEPTVTQTRKIRNRGKSLSRRFGQSERSLSRMSKNLELDRQALKHLQFLDKFQKHMQHVMNLGKRSARSEPQ